jgi:hypothetical protein
VLKGKFKAMGAYFKKTERMQTNNLKMHFKLVKQEEAKPKGSRWKEIINITRVETNELETEKKNTKSQ